MAMVKIADVCMVRARPGWWRYGIAVLSAGLALGARLAMGPWLGSHSPYVTFMVAAAVTVWVAGFWPALLTAALSVPAALLFVIRTEEADPLAKTIGVSVFFLGMIAIAFLGRAMRMALAAAESAAAQARQRQQELDRAKQEWEMTFDAVPDLVAIISPEHRLIRVNRAMARCLGKPPQECSGLTCYRALHGTDAPPDYCPHVRALVERVEQSAEFHEPHLGRDYLVTATPLLDSDGSLIGTVHVARDITDRRRAEEELKQTAADLARSNRDLEQFAYVASHDLQEPLRMVEGHLGIIGRRLGDKLDGDTRESMGFALDGANRMKVLIRDLLAYSRVGRTGKGFVDTDMGAVLEYAKGNLAAVIAETEASISGGSLPTIKAETALMHQLLQNLLGNAIKYRAKDRKPEITVGASRDDNGWGFHVSDNGIGIAPGDYERIFMIFQRLHTRQEYDGTGIGLAICKKIVEHHGGRIWVQSQPGEGSIFRFTIPDRR